jgi:hypothetical protein
MEVENIASAQQPKASAALRLAPEIWRQIALCLVFEDDENALINTWLDVRPVCRQLQATIEAIYAEKVLPEIEIEFKIESRFDYLGGCLERRVYSDTGVGKGFTMEFDRFEAPYSPAPGHIVDDVRAVFKTENFCIEVMYKSSKTELVAESDKLDVEWRADIQLYLGDGSEKSGRFELTPHIVKLRNIINDTELSGLQINYEKREVSFNWRLMFTNLFSEERVVKRLLDDAYDLEQVNFIDLLEYSRLAWAVDNSYSGSRVACQKCAANGEIEFYYTFVRLKGQEYATTPKPPLPPNTDPNVPPHDDSQVLRCPYVWRLFRDVFTKFSAVRRDFPTRVARVHCARRQARERRIEYWYGKHDRTKGIFADDWVSQARILQRLQLLRLLWQDEHKPAGHEYAAEEERLSWYLESHTMPHYEIEGWEDIIDESVKHLRDCAPDDGYPYGIGFDHTNCIVM